MTLLAFVPLRGMFSVIVQPPETGCGEHRQPDECPWGICDTSGWHQRWRNGDGSGSLAFSS